MNNFGISVVGRDEPGIIAAISKVLYTLDCNLADASMSVLSGNFAMVLIAQAPDGLELSRLQHEVALATKRFDVLVSARRLSKPFDQAQSNVRALSPTGAERALVTLYGADRPGIVQGATSVIANTCSNVVDLRTQQTSGPSALYALFMEVELAPGISIEELDKRLKPIAREFSVDLSVKSVASAEL